MKKLKLAALLVMGLLATSLPISAPVFGVTCPSGTTRSGQSVESLALCNTEDTGSNNTLATNLRLIVTFLMGLAGLICVVVIIISGVSMMTAQGDAGKVAKATKALINALIGLVIAILAFAIINFVLDQVF